MSHLQAYARDICHSAPDLKRPLGRMAPLDLIPMPGLGQQRRVFRVIIIVLPDPASGAPCSAM